MSVTAQGRYTPEMPHHPRLSEQINRDQVALVVHHFYQKLLEVPQLADYFAGITNWMEHEAHITDFWWGLMGGRIEKPRPHAMDRGHRDLDFGEHELAIWLVLFEQTLVDTLPPEIALRWGKLARQIGDRLLEHRSLEKRQ